MSFLIAFLRTAAVTGCAGTCRLSMRCSCRARYSDKRNTPRMAVPWLRQLGFSPRRPGFDPGSVHVRFFVDKVALWQVPPPPKYFGFPLSISFHRCSITRKFIIFTGLHNKPQGCGASVASAAGPFTTKKKHPADGLVCTLLMHDELTETFLLHFVETCNEPSEAWKSPKQYITVYVLCTHAIVF
jgi:hypothetical protein